jgi:hypothetical protein
MKKEYLPENFSKNGNGVIIKIKNSPINLYFNDDLKNDSNLYKKFIIYIVL